MEKINIKDIDFSSLKTNRFQGTLSTIYHSDDQCYKIFKKMDNFDEDMLYQKLMAMQDIKLDRVLMPTALIIEGNQLCGYVMPRFDNSLSLNDYFSRTRFVESKDILNAIKRASLILRDIHDQGIIYQDLSFDNILINQEQQIMFCDIDSCYYKPFRSECISMLLKEYMIDYRGELVVISRNLDRLSMMLSMFYLMYYREVQKMTNKRYAYLANNLKSLENAKLYAEILADKNRPIPDIPYLDEIIDDSDEFLIDRAKQVTLVQRLYSFIRR